MATQADVRGKGPAQADPRRLIALTLEQRAWLQLYADAYRVEWLKQALR